MSTVQAPRSYTIEVPGQALGANELRRAHWAKRHRDTAVFRDAVALLAKEAHSGPPLERAHVTVTLIRRRGQSPLDIDNSYQRAKPVVDGLVVGGLLEDDSPAHITLEVKQEQGRCRATRLDVVEVCNEHERESEGRAGLGPG